MVVGDSSVKTEDTGHGWWRQQFKNRRHKRRLVETAVQEQKTQDTVGGDSSSRIEDTGHGWWRQQFKNRRHKRRLVETAVQE